MRILFQLAFKQFRYFYLLSITILSMCILTVASQMEILTVGIITQKGPSFFELFAPNEEPIQEGQITYQQLNSRWSEIDQDNKGYITKEDTDRFLKNQNRKGLINRIMKTIDRVIPISEDISYLILFIMIVALFKAVSLFWYHYSTKLITIQVSRRLRERYFDHIQSLPMSFYQKHPIGSLSSRVATDSLAIAEGLHALLVHYLQTPFTILTTLVLCFLTSWQMSLMIFLGLPLILGPILILARKIKKIAKQLQKNQETFTSILIDFLSGIQTVKIFSMEDYSSKKYQEQNDQMAYLEKKSAKYDLSTRPIVHTLGMFMLASALLFGLYVLNLSIAEVLVYCGFLWVFYEPVKKLAEEHARIQKGIAAAERMEEVLSITPDIQDKPDAIPIQSFTKEIVFNNVSFRYGDEWVLRNFSTTIRKGETIGIVGPTGSGKSTLVQLLPRLYEVTKGEITIDGIPIKNCTQSSLKELISFVPQKPFLFLDTITQNLTYDKPISMEKITHAAQLAHADSFIQQLPQKYDTLLSERGSNLSGGQQQRLAITRALLKESPILILDEATSALDNISEQYIQNSIQSLHGKSTQIIIAHRLTTIASADRIIYLDRGEKIAEGTKDELLKSCTGFRAMWEAMNRQESTDQVLSTT